MKSQGLIRIFNAIGALIGSQGADKHHLQIVGLVLVVLAVYHVYLAARYRRLFRNTLENHRFAIFHAQQAVVATYLVTGLYKLARSGLGWIADAKYFPLQLAKTRGMEYYNRLEEPGAEAGDGAQELLANLSPSIERFVIDSPNWARVILGSGLLLELGVCAAAACLADPSPSAGLLKADDCLALGRQFGFGTFVP